MKKFILLIIVMLLFACNNQLSFDKTIEEIISKKYEGACFYFIDGVDGECVIGSVSNHPISHVVGDITIEVPEKIAKKHDEINQRFQTELFNLLENLEVEVSKEKLMHYNTLLTISYDNNRIKISFGEDNIIVSRYNKETYYTYDSNKFKEQLKNLHNTKQEGYYQIFEELTGY